MLRETLALTAVQSAVLFLALWGIFRLVPSIPANAKAWLWRLAFLKPLLSLLPFAVVSLPFLPAEKPQQVEYVYSYEVPLAPTTATVAVQPSAAPVPHPDLLLVAWALGVVAVAIYGAVGMRRVWRVAEGAELVQDEGLLKAYADLLRAAKVRRWPRLLQSETVASAMLVGGRRSAIVLPMDATIDDLRMMMAHELAHVVRRDLFWFSLASAVQSLFFFNPMVWVAARCSRLDHESATDRHASHLAGVPIQTYADMLLRATVIARPTLSPGSLPVAESYRTIHRRLEAMKHFNSKPTFWRRTATAALAILTLTMLPAYQLCAAAWQKDKVAPAAPTVAQPRQISDFAIYEYDKKKKKYYKVTLSPSNKKVQLKNGNIVFAKSASKGGFYVILKDKNGKKDHVYYTVSKREPVQGVPFHNSKAPVAPAPAKAPIAPPPTGGSAPALPAMPPKGGTVNPPVAPAALPAGAPTPPTTIAPTAAPATAPQAPPVKVRTVNGQTIQITTAAEPKIVTTQGIQTVTTVDGQKVIVTQAKPGTATIVNGQPVTIQSKVLTAKPAIVYTTKGATTFYTPTKVLKAQEVKASAPLQYKVVYGTTLNSQYKIYTAQGTTLATYNKAINLKYELVTGKAPQYINTKYGIYKLVKPNKTTKKIILKPAADPSPKPTTSTNDQGVNDPKSINGGH